MSLSGFALLEVLHLEDATAQTCLTATPEDRIRMLGRAMFSFLKPPKETAEGEFEIRLKGGGYAYVFCDSVVLLRHSGGKWCVYSSSQCRKIETLRLVTQHM